MIHHESIDDDDSKIRSSYLMAEVEVKLRSEIPRQFCVKCEVKSIIFLILFCVFLLLYGPVVLMKGE